MIEISCFALTYDKTPIKIIFIKYERFMKIFLNEKSIIIAIENLKKSQILFQLYILSLLCTENSTIINYENSIYGVSTEMIGFQFHFRGFYEIISLPKRCNKNPLLGQEPIRETSIKKQKKFLRAIDYEYEFFNPLNAIEYYKNQLINDTKIHKIIEYQYS
jgi:hypothetical protein